MRTMPAGPDTISFETRGPGGTSLPRSELKLSPAFLERWALGPKLGAGAMGMVVRATERATGQVVAIKFLTRIDDGPTLKRFVAEGKAMSALASPHVMKVFAFEVEDGHPCLVTEYLAGGTLRELLDRKRALPAPEVQRILADVLAGLAACHERGIVHRDVKPANVMFDAHGRALLGDLGIAKNYGDDQGATAAGAILGTPLYMSPEQVRGEPAGIVSDIYSAGVMGYEMLAGRPPFEGNLIELLQAHESSTPPPLPASVPAPLRTAIEKALSKGVSDRPQRAEDFRRLIAPPAKPASKPSRPVPAPRAQAELPWWSLPIAFVVAMGASGAVAYLRSAPPPPKHKPAPTFSLPPPPTGRPMFRVPEGPKSTAAQTDLRAFLLRVEMLPTVEAEREFLERELRTLAPAQVRELWHHGRRHGDLYFAHLLSLEDEEAVGALGVRVAGANAPGISREQAASRLRAFITTQKRTTDLGLDPYARRQELDPVIRAIGGLSDAACAPGGGEHAGLLVHALHWMGELPDGTLVGHGATREAWTFRSDTARMPPLDETWVFATTEQVARLGFRVR